MALKNKSLVLLLVVILIATVGLFSNAYKNVSNSYSDVLTVIKSQHKKRIYLTEMYNAASERSMILLQMLATTDPFELDELNQLMGEMARIFITARVNILSLDLTSAELDLLEAQRLLASENANLQYEIAGALAVGDRSLADEFLFTKAIPQQHVAAGHTAKMIELYEADSLAAIDRIEGTIARSERNIFIIGSAFVLVSIIMIIVVVTRLSRRDEELLKTTINQLKHSQEKFIQYSDALTTFTALLKPNGDVELINQAAGDMAGMSKELFVGQPFQEGYWFSHDIATQNTIADDLKRCSEGEKIDHEIVVKSAGGYVLIMRFVMTPIFAEDGAVEYLVAEGQDVTERKQSAERLSFEASHDSLTGLVNRREFESRLSQLLARADENTSHYVFYLDLDQFKVVNDTCGHDAGDELLRQVPSVIQTCTRKSDLFGRLGGDEFGLILEYCDLDKAKKVAKSIIEVINDYQFCWKGSTFRVGVSIGIVAIKDNGYRLADVFKHLDTACYAAKDSGRNAYHIYSQQDVTLKMRQSEMGWISRMDKALTEGRFILYAQPIVPIQEGGESKTNYEVLLRMQTAEGETIPPGAFLPAAERYNKMNAIDRWVVENTLQLLSENPKFLDNIGYCSINLSCQSLTDKDFLKFLFEQLGRDKKLPEKICFEITETAAISNLSQATHCINRLRDIGVRFALDDFGSGLSSFGYLKTLPINYLKIDGMFVKDIETDPIDLAMVKSIHEVGAVMALETVAEFVENDEILTQLKAIGVNYAQGYGIGRPKPLQDLLIK